MRSGTTACAPARPIDHWGFAWSPRNSSSLPAADWAAMTGTVLDRLATAIRDSATETPTDPGVRACGPNGRNLWCAGDLDGARLTDNWRAFRAWSPTTLAFVTTPPSVVAGAVSGAITVQAQVAGVPARPAAPVGGDLLLVLAGGAFSTSATGPFTPTVSVTLPGGAFGTAQVFYQDTATGIPTITAVGSGVVAATRSLAVTGAAPISIRLDPPSATVTTGATATFNALGRDALGNEFPVSATWTLAAGTPGALTPATGPTVTFTAAQRPGTGTVTATIVTSTGRSRPRPRSPSRHRRSCASRQSATASRTAACTST